MMDIQQEIKSLKEQGIPDKEVKDLLLLKGRNERQIEDHLKVYYQNLHSTEIVPHKISVSFVLTVVTLILSIIAAILGFLIITS